MRNKDKYEKQQPAAVLVRCINFEKCFRVKENYGLNDLKIILFGENEHS
jgi:hypothetical protein